MIEEAYVSYETARLLNEKEFDEVTIGYYSPEKELNYTFLGETNSSWLDESISAPTLQMAMKWLREVHRICIVIMPIVTDDDGDAECLWNYIISRKLELLYKSECLYESYEITLNNAIKYCLEHLI